MTYETMNEMSRRKKQHSVLQQNVVNTSQTRNTNGMTADLEEGGRKCYDITSCTDLAGYTSS